MWLFLLLKDETLLKKVSPERKNYHMLEGMKNNPINYFKAAVKDKAATVPCCLVFIGMKYVCLK